MSRSVGFTRTIAIAVAVAVAVAITGCGKSTVAERRRPERVPRDRTTTTAAAPSEDYCETVESVIEQTGVGGLLESLPMGPLGSVLDTGELSRYVERLSKSADGQLAEHYEAMSALFERFSHISDSVMWLAATEVNHEHVVEIMEAIDDETRERCGETLIGVDQGLVDIVTADISPRLDQLGDEEFVHIDMKKLFGAEECSSSGSFFDVLDVDQYLISCDDEIFAVDVGAYRLMWSVPWATPFTRLNFRAGVLARADLAVTPASGLSEERRMPEVWAIDTEDGSEMYHFELPPPAGTVDQQRMDPNDIRGLLVAGDGTLIVRVHWNMRDPGSGETSTIVKIYGVTPDGSVAWTKDGWWDDATPGGNYSDTSYGSRYRDVVVLSEGEPGAVLVSAKTGKSVMPDSVASKGPGVIGGAVCGPYFTYTTGEGHQQELTVFDVDSGASTTVALEIAGGKLYSPDLYMTAKGVYVLYRTPYHDAPETASFMVTPEGRKWSIGAGLVGNAETRLGRLFVQNQSNDYLEVDLDTGKELSATPVDVPRDGYVAGDGYLQLKSSINGGVWIRYHEGTAICD